MEGITISWNLENGVRDGPVRKQIFKKWVCCSRVRGITWGPSEPWVIGDGGEEGVAVFILALYFPQGFGTLKPTIWGMFCSL